MVMRVSCAAKKQGEGGEFTDDFHDVQSGGKHYQGGSDQHTYNVGHEGNHREDFIGNVAKNVAGGDIWNQVSGLTGLIQGKKEAPQSYGGSNTKYDKVEEKKELFDLKKFAEWTKLIFNPIELCKSISAHFKIPLEKFIEQLGSHLVYGVQTVLQPLMVTIKIIEKVFVADACRLKIICKMGTHLEFIRSHVLKFSPGFLEGSTHIKALTDGIIGKDCEAVFPNCEPKLKKNFEDLKTDEKSYDSKVAGRSLSDVNRVSASETATTVTTVRKDKTIA